MLANRLPHNAVSSVKGLTDYMQLVMEHCCAQFGSRIDTASEIKRAATGYPYWSSPCNLQSVSESVI